ncbi:MAG: metallophosphoesterase [Armatimonadetes bacterium]|nr:metallophosphoesterase [Armatimonadota bacterium]
MNRDTLLTWLAAGAGFVAGAAITYTALSERLRLTVTRGVFGIRDLPPDLDGLTVAHLTDLHAGPQTPMEFIREAVRLTNRLQPDVVLLTGDYVEEDGEDLAACAEQLGKLRAPLGAYAVLGNHDHEVGAELVAEALQGAGLTVLRNASAPLGEGPSRLWIVGLDDTAGYWGDFRAAFADVSAGEPVVLLSHIPDVLPKAAALDVDLVLTGHTHGGQVRIPALGAPHAPVRLGAAFVSGSRRRGHTRMQINRGIGTTTWPIRYGCPPEIGLFTLRPIVRS